MLVFGWHGHPGEAVQSFQHPELHQPQRDRERGWCRLGLRLGGRVSGPHRKRQKLKVPRGEHYGN